MTGAIGKIYQDVLHPRRPTLNYVSPAICEASFSGTSFATLILSALTGLTPIQGMRSVFDPASGTFRLTWDVYPFVICYNVYEAADAGSPLGAYVLVGSCVLDNFWDTPDCPKCFIVTAITRNGETPFTAPVCTECPPVPPGSPEFFNTAQTATCPSGFTGTPVTIPAGGYNSFFSQANANAKALAAATAALNCVPCVLPDNYYQTFGTNYDGYDPGATPPPGPGNPQGRFVVVNNAGQNIKHLKVDFLGGITQVLTGYYDADLGLPVFPPLTYKNFSWEPYGAGPPPFNNPAVYPETNWHVVATLQDNTVVDAGTQSYTADGQILTFWVGVVPPC